MATKRRPKGQAATRYWRISSVTKANIDLAIKAKQWGMRRRIGVGALKPGDGIAFYVSQGHHAGYWGTARVTSGLFLSKIHVWPDDHYPVRFSLAPDRPPRATPVTRHVVMARLAKRRLTYLRQAGVIQLTAEEYAAIADLLASPTP